MNNECEVTTAYNRQKFSIELPCEIRYESKHAVRFVYNNDEAGTLQAEDAQRKFEDFGPLVAEIKADPMVPYRSKGIHVSNVPIKRLDIGWAWVSVVTEPCSELTNFEMSEEK